MIKGVEAADAPSSSAETAPGAREAAAARRFRLLLLVILVAGLMALVVMSLVAAALMLRSQGYNRWVEHTYKVESDVARLQANVEQAETARRGYLLSPDARYQRIYEEAQALIPGELDRLAVAVLDSRIEAGRVRTLRELTQARAARTARMMAFASRGDIDAAVASFRSDRAQPLLGQIRNITARMLLDEQSLLQQRIRSETDNAEALVAVVLVGVALLTLLSLGAAILMRGYANDLDRTQIALRRLNRELEQRVADRTAELVRANEEIQRFAYIVSHDLRSPLVNVMGFTTELELAAQTVREALAEIDARTPGAVSEKVRTALEVDMSEAIGFIRASSRKMDGLIKAILRLSREGRRTLTPEVLDMNLLVEGLFANVRHALTEKKADGRIEGALQPLFVDRLAVEQIFGNLIDNAVKYLKPGRPGRIAVRSRPEGSYVVYEVEDNGRGVDPRDHDRIFELFRRSGAQDQPGEGIGLAHVKALVYRLGGSIDCVSDLGRGALFRVRLPSTALSPTP